MENESIEMDSKNRTTPTTNEPKGFTLNKTQLALMIFVSIITGAGIALGIKHAVDKSNTNETTKEKLKTEFKNLYN